MSQRAPQGVSQVDSSRSDAGYREYFDAVMDLINQYFSACDWQAELHRLVWTVCFVVTVGMTVVGLDVIYHLMPVALRLPVVPALLYCAYTAVQRLVFPFVFSRLRW